jgi:hypothetical protein
VPEIAIITGHSLKDGKAILDTRYLGRSTKLAVSAAATRVHLCGASEILLSPSRATRTINALSRGLVIAEATRDMITDDLDDFSRPPTPSRRPRRNRIRSNRPVGRKTAADIAPAPRVTRGHLKLYADRDAPEIVITMRWNSRSRCPGNHDHHAPERAL